MVQFSCARETGQIGKSQQQQCRGRMDQEEAEENGLNVKYSFFFHYSEKCVMHCVVNGLSNRLKFKNLKIIQRMAENSVEYDVGIHTITLKQLNDCHTFYVSYCVDCMRSLFCVVVFFGRIKKKMRLTVFDSQCYCASFH